MLYELNIWTIYTTTMVVGTVLSDNFLSVILNLDTFWVEMFTLECNR